MKAKQSVRKTVLVCLCISIAAPFNIFGNEAANSAARDAFSQEELDQMLAPIALYPDSLLAQMLMAATYPLEIVEAARWVGKNPNLQGDLLDQALQDKDWDVSVKSLAHFPDVLAMMDEMIEWTTRVGDAFLAQENDVMDTVQQLRAKAQAAGNLQSTREQKVVTDQNVIMIEPADPEVIYVPVYDPFWVYGPWWYPAYSPYVFYYPGVAITSGFFGFAFGFAAGFGFGWCDWDWHHHHIRIDYDRIGHFHRFDHNRFHGRERWKHNPGHRRGVAYWDRGTSHRFGQSPERSIQNRREVRGYADESPNRQNMFNPNRQEINRGDFHSQEGVRGNESGFRERSERNNRVNRERNEASGLISTKGIQRRREESGVRSRQEGVRGRREVSGPVSRQGVRGRTEVGGPGSAERVQKHPSSAFSGVRDGTSQQRASDRGQFSRGISGGGFRSGSGGSHGGTRGFGSSRSSGGGSHGGSSKGFSRSGGGSYGDARAFFGSGGRGR